MDKVFSARMDEKTIKRIDALSQSMHKSKKKVLEEAIEYYSSKVAGNIDMQIIAESSGAWERKEKPAETVDKAKKSFRESMTRHQKGKK